VVVGIGDDCAVLRGGHPDKYLLYTCDPVVEGVIIDGAIGPARSAGRRWLVILATSRRWAVTALGRGKHRFATRYAHALV